MKLNDFERQSLNGLRKAVEEVYREAIKNKHKLVVGDYKGNSRWIDPAEELRKRSIRRRVLKQLRSNGAKIYSCKGA